MNKKETEKWLLDHGITAYTLRDDLTVDVDARVNLSELKITSIPVQFGIIKGGFDCSNNELTTLRGCPVTISGEFKCSGNLLTSLDVWATKSFF